MTSKIERVVDEMRTMDEKDLRTVLDFAIRQIKLRKQLRSNELLSTLRPGDLVKVTAQIKPAYMRGRIGEVKRVLNTRVEVEFGEPMRRFGSLIRVPATALERVERKNDAQEEASTS